MRQISFSAAPRNLLPLTHQFYDYIKNTPQDRLKSNPMAIPGLAGPKVPHFYTFIYRKQPIPLKISINLLTLKKYKKLSVCDLGAYVGGINHICINNQLMSLSGFQMIFSIELWGSTGSRKESFKTLIL
jgi:hypothetical protein